MKKNIFNLLIIIFISIPAIIPLFHQGFFVTDDGEWMIIRFSAFYSALRDGQFPVRFLHVLNSGYGYPVATFLYPGFMYIGIPIQLITSSFVDTIKIIFGLSLVGSAVFTGFWLRSFYSKTASILGAIISLYLPYHLYDIYTRGSIGEILALVWIPFILWNIERKNILLSSLGITMLILSHNTLALIFIPVIILYLIYKLSDIWPTKKSVIIKYFSPIIFGIGMASFFLLPALIELRFTQFSQINVSNPVAYFANDKLIGAVTFFILALAMVTYLFKRQLNKSLNKLFLLFYFISILSLFMSSLYSQFIWQNIQANWIQFPFRFLSFLLVALPFLTAYIISNLKGLYKNVVISLIILILVISALPFNTPSEFINRSDAYYYTNQATTTVRDEYMPVWVRQKPLQMPQKKVEIITGSGEIKDINYNNKNITFSADMKEMTEIRINTIFWPGWDVKINNAPAKINFINPPGVIQVEIPKGKSEIEAKFNETTFRLISNTLSFIIFIILVFLSRTKKLKIV